VELTDFVRNPDSRGSILENCGNPVFVNSVNPVQVELTDFVGNPEVARDSGRYPGKLWKPC
jgi:hypothetical protein